MRGYANPLLKPLAIATQRPVHGNARDLHEINPIETNTRGPLVGRCQAGKRQLHAIRLQRSGELHVGVLPDFPVIIESRQRTGRKKTGVQNGGEGRGWQKALVAKVNG